MPYAPCALRVLDTDGQFDLEGGPAGLIVPDPDISVVIGDDGVDDRQS